VTRFDSHRVALLQAAFVTFLWSTSWVLIKIGLNDMQLGPISFAGLRYLLAALILLPLATPAVVTAARRPVPGPRAALVGVVALGVLLYGVTQGAQFAALDHLPAVAVALGLSFTPVVVAVATLSSGERATPLQVVSVVAVLAGAALYYGPMELGPEALLGLAIVAIGVLANAGSALLGRALARESLPALGGVIGMTALSMSIGAAVLVVAGLVLEGAPQLDARAWLIIGWLAVVNTALAFTLWNNTMRTLTAVESSVLNNLMLVQIAVLAWVFLGETLDLRQLIGLAIALAGIIAVQLRRGRPAVTASDEPVSA
jgi:drug/metabolite transporter (DMT)-like permease